MNLVIFGLLSPIYFFVLPSLPRCPELPFLVKFRSLDWLGIALNAGVYVTFTIAFTFGGSIWNWSDGRIITLIVVFGILTIIFCLTQRYSVLTNPTNRIFPCEFLNPQLVLLYVCMACGGAALFVSIYYIPLYFLFVYGDSGVHAAVRLLPFVCVYVATTLTCGAAMKRTGYHSVWYLLSGVFMTCGAAGMYTVQHSTPVARIYGFSVLMGLGMTTTQAGYALGPLLVRAERVAEVIQYMNISQGSSQLIGLAIGSGIFQSVGFAQLKDVLRDTQYFDTQIQAAIMGAHSELLQSVSPQLRMQCIDAIVKAMDDVWVMIIAAGALWIVCSLFLMHKRFL